MKSLISLFSLFICFNSYASNYYDLLINCAVEPTSSEEMVYSTVYSDEEYYEEVPFFQELWISAEGFEKMTELYNSETLDPVVVNDAFIELREYNDRPSMVAIQEITYRVENGASNFSISTKSGIKLNLRTLKFSEYLGTDTIWEMTFIVPTWDGKTVTAKTVRNYCMTYFNAG